MVNYALCLEADRTESTFSRMLTAMELETPGCCRNVRGTIIESEEK